MHKNVWCVDTRDIKNNLIIDEQIAFESEQIINYCHVK